MKYTRLSYISSELGMLSCDPKGTIISNVKKRKEERMGTSAGESLFYQFCKVS